MFSSRGRKILLSLIGSQLKEKFMEFTKNIYDIHFSILLDNCIKKVPLMCHEDIVLSSTNCISCFAKFFIYLFF